MREQDRLPRCCAPAKVGHEGSVDADESWISATFVDDDTAEIRAVGGLGLERAELLWDAIEHALTERPGCRVIVDLRFVVEFDGQSIRQLSLCAKTAARRHDDLRLVVDPRGLFGYYLTAILSTYRRSIYLSLSQARD